jgi:hypothetical protein
MRYDTLSHNTIIIQLNLFYSENNLIDNIGLLYHKNLSNNVFSNHYSIHISYNFIASFCPQFVGLCIQELRLNCDDILVAPFSGLSTILFESNFQSLFSIGFEAHPFIYEISKPKIFIPSNLQEVKFS